MSQSVAFAPSAAQVAQRAARTARRKALEAQYRAALQAATGPRCSVCGTPGSLVSAGGYCCSGVVTPCGICGSATCTGHASR